MTTVARLTFLLVMTLLVPLPAAAESSSSSTASLTVVVPPMPLAAEFTSDCEFTIGLTTTVAECVTSLIVADPTLAMTGWRVTIEATAVSCQCGASIDPRNLSIHAVSNPALINGQEINSRLGPIVNVPSIGNSLDVPQVLLTALPEYGNGAYAIDLTVKLAVPSSLVPGTYAPAWKLILDRYSMIQVEG